VDFLKKKIFKERARIHHKEYHVKVTRDAKQDTPRQHNEPYTAEHSPWRCGRELCIVQISNHTLATNCSTTHRAAIAFHRSAGAMEAGNSFNANCITMREKQQHADGP
jgi:hypothetical protein